MFRFVRMTTCFISLSACLQAAAPDISNLPNCITEVRQANAQPPAVPTFDRYKTNYNQLLADLQAAIPHLPYVYQQAAARPLIRYLRNYGPLRFQLLFQTRTNNSQIASLQQIIADACMAVLVFDAQVNLGTNAFSEVVSDLYNSFLSNANRVSQQGTPIEPPTYGVIPPLVTFGNQDAGPYTWPAPATAQMLGLKCAIVSLPPAQLTGGVLAWSSLGHETGGHDVTHADRGLLDELTQQVRRAVNTRFRSPALANYWARCIDETSADALGILNVGPSAGMGLIGYFRALGNGKLRTVGSTSDPHPIDLLRGYFAAAMVKRLSFAGAAEWSATIFAETAKDNAPLYFVDALGNYSPFPVSLADAIASVDVVADTILTAKLQSIQGHSFQELLDWKDSDQAIVDNLVPVIKVSNTLPIELQGPGFYASYVVAAATQAALENGTILSNVFSNMQFFLATMHLQNPTWATVPTNAAIALLEQPSEDWETREGKRIVRYETEEDGQEDAVALLESAEIPEGEAQIVLFDNTEEEKQGEELAS